LRMLKLPFRFRLSISTVVLAHHRHHAMGCGGGQREGWGGMRVIHSSACMDGLERATGMAHDRFDDGRGWTVGDEWVRGRWAWADPWSRKGKGRHQTGPCTV